MATETTKELEKLQSLCSNVNRRYKNNLNDDDAVSDMFKYAAKQDKAVVIIGYDTYQAISAEKLKEYQEIEKTETYTTEEGNTMLKFWHNNEIFRAKKPTT